MKVGWDEGCCKCIYGTQEGLRTSAKSKCTHKRPDVYFVEDEGWMCNSFTRRWETKEDIARGREECGK